MTGGTSGDTAVKSTEEGSRIRGIEEQTTLGPSVQVKEEVSRLLNNTGCMKPAVTFSKLKRDRSDRWEATNRDDSWTGHGGLLYAAGPATDGQLHLIPDLLHHRLSWQVSAANMDATVWFCVHCQHKACTSQRGRGTG